MRLMNFALEQDFKEIFALAAEAKAAKLREQEMQTFFETLDREKHDKQKTKEKEEKETKEFEQLLATSEQIAAFNNRLDDLDTKNVHCLMENGEALDKIHEQLRNMLENAYVLPDGRRIFKTEDGRHVFDEHGAEVARETIDPELIDRHHTAWEAFNATKNAEAKLQTERHEMLEFQTKIDDARARVDKGGMSKKDLDALGADLDANAPPGVRQKLGLERLPDGSANPQTGKAPDTGLDAIADDLRRRSPLSPAPM
jgi:hypothetical protein